MSKFREMLEEALIESFPMFDFANAEGDDDLSDALTSGVAELDDCIGAYFEYVSYGGPGGWGYGRDTSVEDGLRKRVDELERELQITLSSIRDQLNVQSVSLVDGKLVATNYGWGDTYTVGGE